MTTTPNNVVTDLLETIERERSVRVLYACEAGSRSWGTAGPGSDRGVHFIYARKDPLYYVRVDEPPSDTISRQQPAEKAPDGIKTNLHGWDIRKALRLLKKSNPQLTEWVVSEGVHIDRDGLREELLDIATRHGSGAAAIHHYHHQAMNNYRQYLKTGIVKTKEYMHAVQPLLAVKWITEGRPLPVPAGFDELVDERMERAVGADVIAALKALADRGRRGHEFGTGLQIEPLDRFITEQLAATDEDIRREGWMKSHVQTRVPAKRVDRLFRRLIGFGREEGPTETGRAGADGAETGRGTGARPRRPELNSGARS